MDEDDLERIITEEITRSMRKVCGHVEALSKRTDIKEDYPPTIKRNGIDAPLDELTKTAYRKALIQMKKIEMKYVALAKKVLNG